MKKKPLYVVTAALAILTIVIVAIFLVNGYGPDENEIIHRLKPVITDMPTVKAIVVEATGDPNDVGKTAFGLLMSTYFKIKNVPKGRTMAAPRARWQKPSDTPKNEWTGIYALPVPSSVSTLPKVQVPQGFHLALREWHYGKVAEILHTGPYECEDTTVAKLHAFIAENGYEIGGPHEEEYLRGPGLLPGNPEKYLTIIRYQIRKKTIME